MRLNKTIYSQFAHKNYILHETMSYDLRKHIIAHSL